MSATKFSDEINRHIAEQVELRLKQYVTNLTSEMVMLTVARLQRKVFIMETELEASRLAAHAAMQFFFDHAKKLPLKMTEDLENALLAYRIKGEKHGFATGR